MAFKPGFILLAIIAAAVMATSCNNQPRSLFADEPATEQGERQS